MVVELLLIVARIVGGEEIDATTRTEIDTARRDVRLGESSPS
jgi:hypothetical protein